jgi:hypothetical protein
VHNITQLARIGRSVLLKGLDPTTAVEASLARSDDRPSIGAIPSIAAGYVAALCRPGITLFFMPCFLPLKRARARESRSRGLSSRPTLANPRGGN